MAIVEYVESYNRITILKAIKERTNKRETNK